MKTIWNFRQLAFDPRMYTRQRRLSGREGSVQCLRRCLVLAHPPCHQASWSMTGISKMTGTDTALLGVSPGKLGSRLI